VRDDVIQWCGFPMKPRGLDNEVGVDWKRLSRGRPNGRRPYTGSMEAKLLLQIGAREVHLFGFDFGDTPTFFNALDYQTPHDYPAEVCHLRAQAAAGALTISFALRHSGKGRA